MTSRLGRCHTWPGRIRPSGSMRASRSRCRRCARRRSRARTISAARSRKRPSSEEQMSGAGTRPLAVQYDGYGGPDVLRLRDIEPPALGPGHLVVEVKAASLNPIDWKVRSGMLQQLFPMTFPATTGRDGAGTVIAAAPDVDPSWIGAKVCFMAPRGVG